MNTFKHNVDAAAEAEGLAAERFQLELMGKEEMPETPLQRAIREARTAAALGLPAPKKYAYAWSRSCMAHARIERASMKLLVWGNPPSKRTTFDDKARQAEKRLRRAALLVQLKYAPKHQPLDIATAAAMSGLSRRVLERAISTGRVGERSGKRRIIRAGELRRLLAEKLSGHPVGRSVAA